MSFLPIKLENRKKELLDKRGRLQTKIENIKVSMKGIKQNPTNKETVYLLNQIKKTQKIEKKILTPQPTYTIICGYDQVCKCFAKSPGETFYHIAR